MLVDKIRALAKLKGYSLTNLEKELGFGNGTITRWSKSSPSSEKLGKVADFLDVSLDYLTGRDDDKSKIVPKNKNEEELIVLFRETNGVSDSDKEMLVKQFESTIDMYLKAKGIKKE